MSFCSIRNDLLNAMVAAVAQHLSLSVAFMNDPLNLEFCAKIQAAKANVEEAAAILEAHQQEHRCLDHELYRNIDGALLDLDIAFNTINAH